jgi:hypothetical protein
MGEPRRGDERQDRRLVAALVEQTALEDSRIAELEVQLVAIEAKRRSNNPKA